MKLYSIEKKLSKYKKCGQFSFRRNANLREESIGMPESPGIYLIYRITRNTRQLVYIGLSGTLKQNGKLGKQGLKSRINNKQEGKRREKFFNYKIQSEEIDALEIFWYVTFDGELKDIPSYIEAILLQEYFNENSCLPIWNKEF